MNRTGAQLVRFALEQIGVKQTFGIPGVHNTEIYDELNKSESIEPILVVHEGGGAFMADAVSRTSDEIGTLVIVPAAGMSNALSGIGEAFLDGIPMLVISGGVRSDSKFSYQLHQMDQCSLMEHLSKGAFKIDNHEQIIDTIYKAYDLANSGEPGPVFIEIPVNIQLDKGKVTKMAQYKKRRPPQLNDYSLGNAEKIRQAALMLAKAKRPAMFLGYGAIKAHNFSHQIADLLDAPMATSLQGLSAVSANHPLHTGMSFGPAAVPAAQNAFKNCDCLLAVGVRFGEIATGSFGLDVPQNLIHIDINNSVFDVNYPSKIAICADATVALEKLLQQLQEMAIESKNSAKIREQIRSDKLDYKQQWLEHNSKDKVNPQRFFSELRKQLAHDAFLLTDDGNHTFLTAELMPIITPGHFLSPTDFNCMGYAVPAAIGTKLKNPDHQVAAIVGDGAFMMTCMEIVTASNLGLGVIFIVFSDGELAQISQAQQLPYNRKTCTVLGDHFKAKGVAMATGASFVALDNNQQIASSIAQSLELSKKGPVILDVNIDYSKQTCFTKGILNTNLKRFVPNTKVRMVSRAIKRKITG